MSHAFSVTYSHHGKEGTTVLYASSPDEAATAFRECSHPSKELIKVESVGDWLPVAEPKAPQN